MKIKGYTYGYSARRGNLRTEKGILSQDLLYETGLNWMCLAAVVHQDTFSSTDIKFDFSKTVTDRDLMFTIDRAKKRGIKICLKPMINSADGMWRAYIDFPDETMFGGDPYWSKWFESYTAFMLHYAELAEETGCEMLCIGCEMSGTERKEKYWRELIEKIRKIYSGKLTYNTNHGDELKVKWWDALDYIGTSAYYKVAKTGGESAESMMERWLPIRDNLREISEKYKKKILFMEIGCRSARGCATMPWDFTHRDFMRDEDEQANFYESCLKTFFHEDFFEGIFWWDWSTYIYNTKEEAEKDIDFNIHLKKAEQVIKDWYSK